MSFGLILIVIGAVFLLENLGFLPSNAWGVLWPLLIIALGVSFLMKRGRHPFWCCGHKSHSEER